MLNGGPVTWSSRLQKSTAQSTAEAEIIAAADATKEALHLSLMLTELGVIKDKTITIHEDNAALHRARPAASQPTCRQALQGPPTLPPGARGAQEY